MITVFGDWGSLSVDPLNGKVISYRPTNHLPLSEGYGTIERVDLDEWRSHYGRQPPNRIDILDLGLWHHDGRYEPPVWAWRRKLQRRA